MSISLLEADIEQRIKVRNDSVSQLYECTNVMHLIIKFGDHCNTFIINLRIVSCVRHGTKNLHISSIYDNLIMDAYFVDKNTCIKRKGMKGISFLMLYLL